MRRGRRRGDWLHQVWAEYYRPDCSETARKVVEFLREDIRRQDQKAERERREAKRREGATANV